ncbi:hypothetical protein EJA70_00620 [Pseudomonas sp. PB103]|jgi:hypothetical protein|uniref:hypothetical protein n=1 Tax=Pseudomonas sp. PB103 TaxID=2494698 RepID=UPI00131C2E66|nr:hypothetical protein [Pseudomonas sp. PB103]KAE9648795.1 hypothetical protein EJA70_00620 [Pseudomonas sp. PB103]
MSAFRTIAILGVAVVISTAAYSAHFVGQQIEYLHYKLSAPTENQSFATQWPLVEAALPELEDQLPSSLQKATPVSLNNLGSEKR